MPLGLNGKPEIRYRPIAVAQPQNVGRLEISVIDAPIMDVTEPRADLTHDVDDQSRLAAHRVDVVGQAALRQRHRIPDVVVVGLAVGKHRNNVGVVQVFEEPKLTPKPLDGFGVNRDGVLQHFDGDQFAGLAVGGTEDVGEAATTDPSVFQQESPTQRAGLLVRLRPAGLGLTEA